MWDRFIDRFRHLVGNYTRHSNALVKQIEITVVSAGTTYVLSINPADKKNFRVWIADTQVTNEFIARVYNEVVNVVEAPESMAG